MSEKELFEDNLEPKRERKTSLLKDMS